MKKILMVLALCAPMMAFADEGFAEAEANRQRIEQEARSMDNLAKIKRCGVMGRVGAGAQAMRRIAGISVDHYMGSVAKNISARLQAGTMTVAEGNAELTMAEEIALTVFSLPASLTSDFVKQRVQQQCLEGSNR